MTASKKYPERWDLQDAPGMFVRVCKFPQVSFRGLKKGELTLESFPRKLACHQKVGGFYPPKMANSELAWLICPYAGHLEAEAGTSCDGQTMTFHGPRKKIDGLVIFSFGHLLRHFGVDRPSKEGPIQVEQKSYSCICYLHINKTRQFCSS